MFGWLSHGPLLTDVCPGAEFKYKLDEAHALLTVTGNTAARTLLIVLHVPSRQWRVAGVRCVCAVRETMRDVTVADLSQDVGRGATCACMRFVAFILLAPLRIIVWRIIVWRYNERNREAKLTGADLTLYASLSLRLFLHLLPLLH